MHCASTFLLATMEAERKMTVHCVLTFLIATLEDELNATVCALHSRFFFDYSGR